MHHRHGWTSARLLTSLLIVLVALFCVPTPAFGSPAGVDAARLYELTNQARAQQGLPALVYDDAAAGVAQGWAAELARSGNLRHNPDLVAQVDAQVTRAWTRVGENVGYAGSVDQVHTAYMNSPSHRANVLGNYNRVGVGTVRDANERLWTTVVFLQGPPLGVAQTTFAPFASAQAFATQQFLELLSRPPDAAGLSDWTNALQSGQATPAGMVASLASSPESSLLVDPVNRLYWGYFDRIPDAGGVQYWVGRLRAGTTLGQISAVFATSPEFVAMYGSLRDDAFVDLVYRNVLRREPDAYGKAYWIAQLTTRRVDRGGMMVSFTESPEFKSDSASWNAVVEIYVGMLRRAPDDPALTYWTTELRGGRPLGDLTSTVLGSAEYQERFRSGTG